MNKCIIIPINNELNSFTVYIIKKLQTIVNDRRKENKHLTATIFYMFFYNLQTLAQQHTIIPVYYIILSKAFHYLGICMVAEWADLVFLLSTSTNLFFHKNQTLSPHVEDKTIVNTSQTSTFPSQDSNLNLLKFLSII